MPSLYRYQERAKAALVESLSCHRAALDASDTGTGKTFTACAVAAAMGKPVGVVCPKAVRLAWTRVLELFGVKPLFVENYERMSRGNTGWGKWLTTKKANFVWSGQLTDETLLIWDEVHKAKTSKSQNAKMLRDAHRAGFSNLLLSATAAETPLDMKVIGHVLGLHDFQGFHWWALDMGCSGTFGALEFYDTSPGALDPLHKAIFPGRGYRVRIEDLPPGEFPENVVLVDEIDFGDDGEIAKIYAKVAKEIRELEEKESGDTGGTALTLELRARQRAELLKVPYLEEKAKDLLEEGKSVVVFVNFTQSLEALAGRFPGCSIVRGGQSEEVRDQQIAQFQSNAVRVILVNSEAGGTGVSLHDEHGGHPRVSLICPSYNGRTLKQILGRIHRKNGKTKCLQIMCVAAGTIEEKVLEAANLKMNRMNEVNNGSPTEPPVIDVDVVLVPSETPEERPHAKRSPSQLKMFDKCPRYLPNNETNPMAERGTAMHLAMETDSWAHITDPEEIGLLRKTQGFIDAVKRKNGSPDEDHREIRLIMDLNLPQEWQPEDRDVFGTCDRFMVYGNFAIMADYKFGYRMVDNPKDNRQSHAYVLGAFDRFPGIFSITFFFLIPRQDAVLHHTFTRADIPRLRQELRGIIVRSVDPNSPHKPASDLCEFCLRNLTGNCPAIFAKGRELAMKYDGGLELPDILHGSEIKDPAMMAQALLLAPILEKWAEGVRRAAKDMVTGQKLEIPGYRLAVQPGPREIVAPKKAYEKVKHILTPEEFAACTDVSVTKLFEAIRSKAPKGKKKELAESVEDALLDAGLLERGNPRIFVTRDHAKKEVEALPEKNEQLALASV